MQFDLLFKILFFSILIIIVNSYLIYPLIIKLFSLFKPRTVHSYITPKVSILISAYNEEKVIKDRIENISKLNYDHSKIEVLVGSDCSNDDTNKILVQLAEKNEWVKIFLFEERRGKAAVLNDLADAANNEYLIFTDANTIFTVNTLSNLLLGFDDEKVGGICGKLILTDDPSIKREGVEERSYWQYESFIKQAEGESGILIGATGGVFAIRKNLYTKVPQDTPVTDDFFISLSVLSKGYKFNYNKSALAYELVGKNLNSEYSRKVRFAATNFQSIIYFKKLLFNKSFLISYAFWSHKLIRWFFPIAAFILLITNLLLLERSNFYLLFFYGQICFYFFSAIGFLLSKIKIRIIVFSMPYFFLLANIALVVGFFKFITKKHSMVWETTER